MEIFTQHRGHIWNIFLNTVHKMTEIQFFHLKQRFFKRVFILYIKFKLSLVETPLSGAT